MSRRQYILIHLALCALPSARAQTSDAPPPPASTSPSGEAAEQEEFCISEGNCFAAKPKLKVDRLEPPVGPVDGDTKIIIRGSGYRNFGSLMRCRFGTREVIAEMHYEEYAEVRPFNHTTLSCISPKAPTDEEQTVALEVSLNGLDFSSSGRVFDYYRHPVVTTLSPERGSATSPQVMTLTRSTSSVSGGWSPAGEGAVQAALRRCRFQDIVDVDGKRQVPYSAEVNASRADDTELQCITPSVRFVAPVRVEVSLNGQQFSSTGPRFLYEDNWHSPYASGSPPDGRWGMAVARIGQKVYYFGGEGGHLSMEGEGFLDDLYALHMDAMTDYYPSEYARDLVWQKLSLSTGGVPPSARSWASFVAHGKSLYLFGGSSSAYGDMHNSTFEFNTESESWYQTAVSGGPVAPRAAHTAVVCARIDNCDTIDGNTKMFVYGGWGMEPCTSTRQCLTHIGDLLELDLSSMHWSLVEVNREQPSPPKRKGHTATLVNGSTMIVFGGSAWVPDPEADNSYGYTTKHVNDLWSIALDGSDDFTWHTPYAVGDWPSPREGHAATMLAGRYLVVTGGYDTWQGFHNDTYVLDTKSYPMVWTRPTLTGAIPFSRTASAVVQLPGDEVLVFGGTSLRGEENDLYILQLGVGNEQHYPALPRYT